MELLEFACRYDLDLILVSETHLRAADEPRLPNYSLFRTDRQTARGGGTALYVKSSLEHFAVNVPPLRGHIEATAVCVRTNGHGTIRFVSVYNPPRRSLIQHDLEALLEGNDPVIIAGDLNSKHPSWNSRVTNTNGRFLHGFADTRNIVVDGPLEPTHFGAIGRPDVLDIAIFKDVTLQHRLNVVSELDSDHNPVLMHLGDEHEQRGDVSTSVSWPAFTDHLQNTLGRIPMIHTTADLEVSVQRFTSCIQSSIQFATNVKPVADRRNILPQLVRDLIREKNRARRLAQRTMNPADKLEANRLAGEVHFAIATHRNSAWEAKLESLETEDNSLWRMAKALRTKRSPIPPIHGENGVAYSDSDKAEAFADNLERQCSPSYRNADVVHIGRINTRIRQSLRRVDPTHLQPTSIEEVRKRISALKTKKASGSDGVSNSALKALPKKALAALTGMLNAMLRLRYFPSQWKCAEVVVLPKPGQPGTFPQNYRPISLLPVIGKLAEGIVLRRLQAAIDVNQAIQDEQFGFRSGHSTVHQILRVVEQVTEGFNKKQSTGAIFLDVSKAFDKVWHQGLLHKMLEANVPLALTQLVASFLTKRSFRIKLNGSRSTERRLSAGVPQGSLLSPTLFSIYVRDLPGTVNTKTALYADDTAIVASSLSPRLITQRLQAATDELENWFRTWRLEINPDKSSAILLTKRRHQPDGNISIFGRPIPWRNQVKYLGVTLDSKLTWGPHIDSCTNRAKAATAALYPLINRRSKLSVDNKLRIYKSIIRPSMTYAATVWGYAADTHMKKLQTIQNKALRMAFDAPWFVRNTNLHADAGVVTIKEFLRNSAVRFYGSLQNHMNPLIRQLGDYDEDIRHRHKRPKVIIVPPPM